MDGFGRRGDVFGEGDGGGVLGQGGEEEGGHGSVEGAILGVGSWSLRWEEKGLGGGFGSSREEEEGVGFEPGVEFGPVEGGGEEGMAG